MSGAANWTALAVGGQDSCALAADGQLRCWGANTHGQLGSGDSADRAAPARSGGEASFQRLALGRERACAIRAGALFCWGNNELGALGHDDGLVPGPIGDPTLAR